MDRILNYIFLVLLIYAFTLWMTAEMHQQLLVGVVVSLTLAFFSLLLGWLTLDGAAAAIVIGSVILGLGGWSIAVVLGAFFLSSAPVITGDQLSTDIGERRNGLQVWANGFWPVLWLLLAVMFSEVVFVAAAVASLAVATADTWASQWGSMRFSTPTYLISTREQVAAGTDGGISLAGVGASLAGGLFISAVAALSFQFSYFLLFSICLTALAGSLFDSYLGAVFQSTNIAFNLNGKGSEISIPITNNIVNWLSTGLASFVLLILNFVIL